ncbi:MAG: 3-oxoacyl-[acyl-carrier protein] reductase [uncultured Chloroflexia bacterium]|uniref:3-oxoacyl-[acyl-carrier protein] reductase n=1 Tax=uncultured Chloroflexia bacterium TaxID=1672391 RepID=A0A6J4JSK9_9CHLR|nr:MAG: 3-oxoacyl-[acyl-carrier protein] reductase [uncultured Chloroflexia bacterium]
MNKIALITGANRGLGLEAARQLAQDQGFTVILGARDLTKGEAAAATLRQSGLDAHAVQLEVSQETSVGNAVREVEEKFGHLDVLINNAGISPEYPAGQLSPSQLSAATIRQIYDTNFFGALSVLQAFVPLLEKSHAPRVVNVSSEIGSLANISNPQWFAYGVNTLAYSSSKAALNVLTVAFAKEFAGAKWKINSACPGWVKTELGTQDAPGEVEDGARIYVTLATLPPDGPTGQFFNGSGSMAW